MRLVLILLLTLNYVVAGVARRPLRPTTTIDIDVNLYEQRESHQAMLDSMMAPASTPGPRTVFKQATRQGIVARQQQKAAWQARGLVARQAAASATTYPACTAAATAGPIPGSGFSRLTGWYINRVSPYDVVSLHFTSRAEGAICQR
jgi:hypothetical protein